MLTMVLGSEALKGMFTGDVREAGVKHCQYLHWLNLANHGPAVPPISFKTWAQASKE